MRGLAGVSIRASLLTHAWCIASTRAETGSAPVFLVAMVLNLAMQSICETKSCPSPMCGLATNTNFLFGEDYEQLRYEECVLAQGALIQVQQGLGKHMATTICNSFGTEVKELLVGTENFEQQERG